MRSLRDPATISVASADRRWRRALFGSSALVAHALFFVPPLLVGHPALAQQPTGGTVAAGQVSISQQPGRTVVTQGTEKGVVNWQGFSVGKTESVDFIQPGRSSVTLNRVTGTSASNIEGRITATGQVMLINPNGVLFNQGSRVDVGGLVATTSNIRDADFLKGDYRFGEGSANADARVVNRGTINIQQGGYAALSAAAVENTGTIDAQVGTVVLGGAKTFTLDLHGDKLLSFRIDQPVEQAPAGAEALIDQRGKITATGGRVVLSARAAKGVIDKVVNMTGAVEAQAARMEGGEIIIDGGETGRVNVSGSINTSGLASGQTGGTVKVLGDDVQLTEQAKITATGDAGGGVVLVGGNYLGKGPERNARTAFVAETVMIDASAINAGNGGKVVIWSDQTTRFNGQIAARGGALAGDGGFIETSGKQYLQVGNGARVNTSAARGAVGNWLLDPDTVTIATAGAATYNQVDSGLTGNKTVSPGTLETASLTSNITIVGATSITLTDSVSLSTLGRTITFQTDNAYINNSITTNNGGFTVTNAAATGLASLVTFGATGAINTGTAAISLGASAVQLKGSLTGGSIAFGSAAVTLIGASTLTSTGGTQIGAVDGAFALKLAGAGTTTFNGAIGGTTPLGSLDATATKFATGAGTLFTVGTQSFGGAVVLGVNTTLSSTNAALTFASTIAGSGAETLTLNSGTAAIALGGAVTAIGSFTSMATGAGILTTAGNIVTTGAQSYAGNVVLGADTVFSTTNSAIDFAGTLSGGKIGTIGVGTGLATVTGVVSGLVNLNQAAGGTLRINGGTVSTSGSQSYAGKLILGNDTTFSTTGGAVTFGGSVDALTSGGQTLLTAVTGSVSLVGGAGGTTALSTLNLGAATVGGVIRTTGTQSYSGALTLAAATTFSTTNAAIRFGSTVTGTAALNVDTGSAALTTLGDIVTVGAQSYANAVTLGANILFSTNNAAINFGSTLNGGFIGTINSGTALTTITGLVSGLVNLNQVAGGTLRFNGGTVSTSGSQSYAGKLILGNDTTFSTGSVGVVFGGSVDALTSGGQTLLTAGTGAVSLVGGAGVTTALSTLNLGAATVGGVIRTTGTQSYSGALTLAAATTFSTTNAAIRFGSTVTGTAALNVDTGSAALTTLGDIVTSGTQSYAGPVTLGANTLFSTTNAAIAFGGALNGGFAGTIASGSGAVTLGGLVSGLTSLDSTGSGTVTINAASVTTTGTQSYVGAVSLGGTTAFSTTNAAIRFGSTVTGTAALNVNTGSAALTTLGDIVTVGTQSYANAVTLGADTVFSTTNAAINFGNTLNGGFIGTINSGTALTTITGVVSGLVNLNQAAGGTLRLNGGTVSTSGSQSYAGKLILGADTTFSTGSVGVVFGGSVDALTSGGQTLLTAGTGAVSLVGGVGSTTALSALNIGAATVGGVIRTTGTQSYSGALTLAAATTFSTTNAAISLGALNGGFDGTISSGTALATLSGAITGLASLTATGVGGLTVTSGSIVTSGTQSYAGPVTLGANTLFSTTNAAIAFGGALNGGFAGTIASGSGAVTLGGLVSGLTSLDSTGSGTVTINAASVTTTGTQSYVGAVSLGGTTAFSTTNAAIRFGSTVTGTAALNVNTGSAALTTLGNIVTVGTQSYANAVTLGANTVFSTTNAAINFGGALNGGFIGTINSGTALTTITGVVSGLVNLNQVAGGTLRFNGGTVSTSGSQSYAGKLILGADTTFSTGSVGVVFGGSVDALTSGGQTLLTAGTGAVSLVGGVGSTTALSALNIGAATVGGVIRTTGTQSYSGAVTLAAATTFSTTNSTINFGNLTGGFAGTIAVGTGTAIVSGSITGLASLNQTAGGTLKLDGGVVTTTGSQNYAGSVLLGSNTTFTISGVGDLTFGGGLNAVTAGAQGITAAVGTNTVSLAGGAGGTTALSNLDLARAALGGTIITAGTQSYGTAVTLVANTTLSAVADGLMFGSATTINGGFTLNLATGGTVTLTGGVGGTTPLAGLTNPGVTVLGGTLKAGAQSYSGAVLLNAATTLSTSGATLKFGSTIDGNQSLTFDSGVGVVSLAGVVGGTTALSTLTSLGTGMVNIGGDVTTTGTQSYAGAVALGGNIAFSTANAALVFGGSLNATTVGGQSASFSAGTATVSLAGGVGGTTALAALTLDAAAIGGVLVTTGTQSFTTAVTLLSATTLSTTGGDILFGTASLNGAQTLALKSAGTVSLTGGAGATVALTGLTSTGVVALGGVFKVGSQSYGGQVLLSGAATTLSSGGGAINFGSTIDGTTSGTKALTLDSGAGTVSFAGAVGGTTALASLNSAGSGAIRISGGSIVTTGVQSYASQIIMATNTAFTTAGGNVLMAGALNATVAGGQSATLAIAAGTASFAAAVGGTASLAALTVSGAGVSSVKNVTTTGTQIFAGSLLTNGTLIAPTGINVGGSMTLLGATLLNSSGSNGNLTISGAINGAQTLTLNSGTGAIALGGGLGGVTALTSLTQIGTGAVSLGGSATTSGTQAYTGALNVSGTVALSTTNAAITLGSVSGTSTNLTFNPGSGTLTASGAITLSGTSSLGINLAGGGASFGNVSVSAGTVAINATGGAITFGGDLTANTFTTNAGAYSLAFLGTGTSAVTGVATTLSNTGGITFGSSGTSVFDVGAAGLTATASTITLFGTIRTNSVALSLGTITLSGAGAIDTTGGATAGANVSITGAVNGAQNLSITVGTGTLSFAGAVGGTVALNNLNVIGAAGTAILNGVTVTGSQSYAGAVRLNGNLVAPTGLGFGGSVTLLGGVTLTSAGGGATQSFGGAIDGAQALTLSSGGVISMAGAVGAVTALSSLTVSAGTLTLPAGVRTSGTQSYANAVTLATGTTLSTTNAAINIASTLNGSQSLTIATGTGTFGVVGAVGGVTGLAGLTINSSGGANFAAATNVAGGTVNLAGGTGTVTFNGLTAKSLTTSAAAYAIALSNGTITDATSILNSGGVTLTGLNSFTGGFTATNPVKLAGTLQASGGAVTLGSTVLTGNSTVTAGGGALIIGATDGLFGLALNAGVNAVTLGGGIGQTTALTSLSASGSSIAMNAINVTTSGNQTYTGPATVGGVLTTTGAGVISFGSAITLGANTTASIGGGQLSLTTLDGAGVRSFTLSATGGSTVTATSLSNLTGLLVSSAGAVSVSGATTVAGGVTLNNNGGAAGSFNFAGGMTATSLTTVANPFALNISGGAITNAVTLSNTGAVTITGKLDFTGGVTRSGGGATNLGGTITTAGSNAVVLGALTLTGAGLIDTDIGGALNGAVTVGTINGAQTLSVKTGVSAAVTLGVVGGTTALTSLDVASGSANLQAVTTTGTQTYTLTTTAALGGGLTTTGAGTIDLSGAAITLAGATTLTAGGTGAIRLKSVVGGGQALTLNAGATVSATGAITGLTSLTIANSTGGAFGGTINTTSLAITASTGTLTFTDDITATTLTAAAGTYGLAFNTTGTSTISGAATSLLNTGGVVFGAGIFRANGGLTSTASTVTLNGTLRTAGNAVSLGAVVAAGGTVTIDTTNAGGNAAGNSVSMTALNGQTAGSNAVIVNGGTGGAVTLGPVGATTQLGALTVTGASIAVGNVSTGAAQTYNGPISLGGTLLTTGGGSAVTVNGAVTLSANSTINTSAGNAAITLASTVTGAGNSLTVVAGTGAISAGAMAGLSSLTVTSANTAGFSSVNSTGSISLGAAVLAATFSGSVTAASFSTAAGAGSVSLSSGATISGAGSFLNTGGLTLGGGVSFGTGITASAGTTNLSGTITTTGSAATFGSVILGGGTTLSTTGGAVKLGTVDGANQLTIAAGAGATTLGAVGGTTLLGALSVTAGSIELGGSVRTNSALVSLNAPAITLPAAVTTTISTGGGNVVLGQAAGNISSTGGTGSLVLTSGSGGISVPGNITGLAGLTLIGTNTSASLASITVTGATNVAAFTGATPGAASITFTGTVTSQDFITSSTELTIGFQKNATFNSSGNLTLSNLGGIVTGVIAGPAITFFNPNGLTVLGPQVNNSGIVYQTAGQALVFNTAQVLTGTTIYDTTNAGASPGGANIFLTTLNSDAIGTPRSATVKAGTAGTLSFSGAVGGITALGLLDVQSAAKAILNGVTTTGNQVYATPVTSNGDLKTTGTGAITFNAGANLTLGANQTISTGNNGAVQLQAVAGGSKNLTIMGGTAGGTGAVTVAGAIAGVSALTVGAGATIAFNNTVNVSGTLTLDRGTSASLTGAVTVNTLAQSGNWTTGGISIDGGLTATSLTTTSAAYSIAFNSASTVTNAVTFNNTGGVVVSGSTNLQGGGTYTSGVLTIDNSLSSNTAPITLSSVAVTGAATISTTGGALTTTTVNGPGGLTLNAAAGTVTIGSAGQTTSLAALTVTGGSIVTTGAISSAGAQNYTGPVTLGGNLTTTAGALTVNSAATLSANVIISAVGAVNIQSVTAAGKNFNLAAGTGTATVAGAVSLGSGTLTLGVQAGASFNQTVTAAALDLAGGTGAIGFGQSVTVTSLTTAAQGYGVTFTNGVTVNGGLADFVNTGGVTLGGTSQFAGGVKSQAGMTTLQGDLRTSGTTVTLAAVTLAAGSTIDTTNAGGSPAGAAVTTGAINGAFALGITAGTGGTVALGAVGQTVALTNLTTNAAANSLVAVTTSGAQNYTATTTTLAGDLKVNAAGNGVTVSGAVVLAAGGGTIGLTGSAAGNAVSLGTVNGNQALDITANGGGVVIGAIGQTTGLASVKITSAGATLQSVKTSGAIDLATSVNLGGTLQTTGGAAGTITVTGAVTLTADTTVKTANAAVQLASVAGGGPARSLTIDSGTGTVQASAAVAGLSGLTIVNSGGGAFTGSVSTAGAIAINGGTGVLAFNGGFTAASMTIGAGAFGLSFVGGGSVSAAGGIIDFQNTGGLTLGNATGDVFTFAGGLKRTGAATVHGTVQTAGAAIELGSVTLAGDTRLLTTANATPAGAAIKTGAIDGGGNLAIDAGSVGSISFAGGLGQTTALASLTAAAAGITAVSVKTTGSQSYAGATVLSGSYQTTNALFGVSGGTSTLGGATTIATGNGALTMVGVSGGGNALTLDGGSGSVSISGAITNVSTLSLLNAGGASFGSVTTSTEVKVTAATGTVDFTAGLTTDTLTIAGGVSAVRIVNATIKNNVNPLNTGLLTLAGTSLFKGGISTTGPIAIGGIVRTDGALASFGSVTVQGASTIDTTNAGATPAGAGITTGAIDGAQALTLISGTSGTVTLGGAVGVGTALASLNVTAATIIVSSNVTTTGSQSYAGAMTLPGGMTSALTAGGAFTATGAISIGTNGLATITSNGALALGSVAGSLGSTLTLDAGPSGSVTASGSILDLKTFTLQQSAGATFTGIVGQPNPSPAIPYTDIYLNNTVGLVTFNGFVSSNILQSDTSAFSLSLAQGGDIAVGTINNSGGLGLVLSGSTTFRNGLGAVNVPITLSGTLSSPGAAVPINKLNISGTAVIDTRTGGGAPDAPITITSINGSINGKGDLTLISGGSAITIGSVGTLSVLGSIDATGGSITLNGSATTTGDQKWNGPLTVGGNLITTGGGAITVTGDTVLTVDTIIDTSAGNGAVSFGKISTSGGLKALSVSTGTGSLSMAGAITGLSALTLPSVGNAVFTNDLSVAGKIAIGTSNGSIAFQGLLSATGLTAGAGSYSLTFDKTTTITSATAVDLSNTGMVTIGDKFFADAGFVHDKGITTFKGDLLQTIGGVITLSDLVLGQSTTLDTTGAGANNSGGAVTTGVVSGVGTLTIKGGATGSVVLGNIGDAGALDGVSISGGVITLQNVKTSSAQSYSGSVVMTGAVSASAVTLTGSASVGTGKNASITTKSSNGAITLDSLDGAGTLSMDAGTGTITFKGAIGAISTLSSLTATGGAVLLPSLMKLGAGSITNGQLTKASTVDISGGNLTLTKLQGTALTSSGTGKLLISDAKLTGSADFKNSGGVDLSKTNSFGSGLNVSGPATVTGSLTTTGSLTFGGTLTADADITSGGLMTVVGPTTIAGVITAGGGLTMATVQQSGSLTITSQGNVTLGDVGSSGAQTSLTISSSSLTLGSVRTTGNQAYTVAAGASLGGNLIAGAGNSISMVGGLSLTAGSHTIGFSGSSVNNRILLGAVNGPGSLALSAGAGGVLIGSTGQTQAIGSFSSDAAITFVATTATAQERTRAATMLTQSLAQLAGPNDIIALVNYLAAQPPLAAANLRSTGTQTYSGVGVYSGQISTIGSNAGINVNRAALLVGNSRFDTSAGGGTITLAALDSVIAYRSDVAIAAGSGRVILGGIGQDPPVGALTISSSGGTTFNGDVAARTLSVTGSVNLGNNISIVTDPATGGVSITGNLNGANQNLSINAGLGNVSIGGVTVANFTVTQAASVTTSSVTADQISVNATGAVSLGQVRAGATSISANNIRGNFTVSALALSASFAEVGAIVGGVSDSSIFSRIRFGISGTYLINGLDAIRVLQSSGRGLESQTLAQLLNSILNGSLSSSGKGDSDKNEGGEGGKKSGTTVLIPGLLSQEAPRSAASEQGVPGLNQRFPGLPNTALW